MTYLEVDGVQLFDREVGEGIPTAATTSTGKLSGVQGLALYPTV
jgi:hypothetical protein